MKRRVLLSSIAASVAAAAFALPASAQVITLHGASQFNDEHPFTKGLLKFEELVKKYYGKPINFVLHKNSELGLEKDYFAYMNQGISVDYGIVSPAHMSTFAKAAPFIDAPFVFRDHDQMNKVIAQDVLKPIADEIAKKADVLLIGYGGGGVRSIFATKPVRNMAELKNLKIRVQGAPIWTRTFAAAGMSPDRHRLQRDLQRHPDRRDRGRRERGGGRRADEVLRSRAQPDADPARDQHPADLLLRQEPAQSCPPTCRRRSARPAPKPATGSVQLESNSDTTILAAMEKAGKLKLVKFDERDKLRESMAPVLAAYAKEIGADAIYANIQRDQVSA